MYLGGKLASHPDLVTVYIAFHRQMCSSDISILLQLQRTLSFSLNSLDFWNVSDFSVPGKLIFYVMRYGQETANLRIICVESTKPCNL